MLDGRGTPLASQVIGANVPDVRGLLPTVVASPSGEHGTAERLPDRLCGDRAYGSAWHEGFLRWMEIEPVFAQRNTPHGSGPRRVRYVVKRSIANIHQNRRLKLRYEPRYDIHRAFLSLACITICWNRLPEKLKRTKCVLLGLLSWLEVFGPQDYRFDSATVGAPWRRLPAGALVTIEQVASIRPPLDHRGAGS